MPVAPRANKKATKIAWRLLGTPPNLDKRQGKRNKDREQQIDALETNLVR